MAGFPRSRAWHVVAVTATALLAVARADISRACCGGEGRAIRTFDPLSLGLVRSAASASPTVAGLIDALAESDVLVVVELTRDTSGLAGDLHYQVSAGGVRYLRIRVSATIMPWDQIVILGHELQHATEVACDPDVRDAAGLADLMRRIGKATHRDAFETDAAVAVMRQVRVEILSPKPHRAAAQIVENARR